MADWNFPPDTDVDPDAPVTSELMYALRDNPVAIAEGAAGAPRIVDAALDAGPETPAGVEWVGKRVAAAGWNAVGQFVFAHRDGASNPGATVAGSQLYASGTAGTPSTTLPGTWRCQGRTASSSSTPQNATVWKRIS